MNRTYYDVLGISKNATQEMIEIAYSMLWKQYHSSAYSSRDSQEKLNELNEAYEVLSNVEKRQIYDSIINNGHSNGYSGMNPVKSNDSFFRRKWFAIILSILAFLILVVGTVFVVLCFDTDDSSDNSSYYEDSYNYTDEDDSDTADIESIDQYVDLLGMKVSDAEKILGNNFSGEYVDGEPGHYYEDLGVFFSNQNPIDTIVTSEDLKLIDGLSGYMTYPEIKAVVDYVEEPENVALTRGNDEWGDYELEFNYKGYSFIYCWNENPYKSDLSMVFVKRSNY